MSPMTNKNSIGHNMPTFLTTLPATKSAEYRSDLHLVFVDFEKAFDSVVLWMALKRRGILNKIVSVIKSTYNGAKDA